MAVANQTKNNQVGTEPKDLIENTGLVSISKAAKILDVSIDTVRRWDKQGILHSTRPDGKNRHFSIEELESVKFSQPMAISEVSEKLNISPSTLRRLDAKGLMTPDRNEAGERVYGRQALQSFLQSEYFLRQKEVQDEILEPLDSRKEDEGPKDADKPHHDPTVHALLGEHHVTLASLKRFRKLLLSSVGIVVAGFGLIIVVITVLFLLFPESTAKTLGYNKLDPLNRRFTFQPNRSLLARQLKPFSQTALRVVEVVNPDLRSRVAPAVAIEDINDVFKPDSEGNVKSVYNLTVPDSSYLVWPDKGLVENFNSELLQGRVPGCEKGNLAIVGACAPSSIATTASPTAAGPTTVVNTTTPASTTTTGSGDIEEVIAGIGLSGGGDSGSVTLNVGVGDGLSGGADTIGLNLQSGGGLQTTPAGLSLLRTCANAEILKWNGSAWVCSADTGGGGGGSITVRESDGSPAVNPTSILQFDASKFTVTDLTGGTAQVGIAANGITLATDTTGSYVANITSGNGLTVSGAGGENATANISLVLNPAGGLQANVSGLGLTTTCSSSQILKWNGTNWACAADTGGLTVKKNDLVVTANANTLDYSTDFSVSESPAGEDNIGIDYAASGITRRTQTELISGSWSFNDNSFALQDNSDNTKKTVFEVSGVSSGTTTTLTVPNYSGSLVITPTPGTAGQLIIANATGVPTFATLSGDGTLSAAGVLTLSNSGVTAGTYGSASQVPQVAVDAKGRITSASNVNIAIDASQINTGTLGVPRGGTGAGSFTSNGVVYGNGTSALQNTAAGTSGQVLVANTLGVPSFVSFSGDVTVAAGGVTAVQANAVELAVDTIGSFVNTITTGNGLSVSGVGAENATASISLAVQANKGLEADVSGLSLIDCANNQILKYSTITNTWGCQADADTGAGFTVRESDGSPSVSGATALEFGPGVISTDEFVVTSQGGGAARVTIGSQVAKLNEAETVSGGWTFNTLPTTFTTNIVANGGLSCIDCITLGSETTGDYVVSVTAGSGLSGSVTGEGSTPTLALGPLTANWDQTGAFDIVLNNSGSELRMLESGLTPSFYATIDAGDLTADAVVTINSGISLAGGGNALTLAGNLTTAGANPLTLTTTGATNVTLPTSGTLATLSGGETLRNKLLVDASTRLIDDADNTKQLAFEVAGITTGTTRTLTAPNVNGTIITSGNLTDINTVGTITAGTWQGTAIGVAYGGTGATTLTSNGVLYGNGSGAVQASAAGTAGQLLVANALGVPTFVSASGDATLAASGTLTLASTGVAAGTYGSATQVPQIIVDAKGRITGASNVTISGVTPGGVAGGDLSGTYPNPTVARINGATLGTTTATAGNLLIGDGTSWVTRALSGDVTVSSLGVTAVGADAVALGVDTTGSYVASFTAGNGLSGDAAGEGSVPTINVGAGSGISVDASAVSVVLNTAIDTLNTATSSRSGLEFSDSGGLTLLQGCTNNQILKFNTTTNLWACASETVSTTPDLDSVYDADSDKKLAVDNGSGIEFESSTAGSVIFDLASTGDLEIQDGGITFASFNDNGTLTIQGATTFSGDINANDTSADNIFLGQNGVTPDVVTIAGNVSVTDSDWSVSAAGIATFSNITCNSTACITLGTETDGSYVASITAGNGLTGDVNSEGGVAALAVGAGNGISVATDAVAVKLLDEADNIGNSSSQSGLEFGGADSSELGLLRGCSNDQILKWNVSLNVWNCAADATGGAGSSSLVVEENDVSISTTTTNLDFLGSDFDLNQNPASEVNIAIDYINSGITRKTQNEAITGDWGFSLNGAENLDINSDLAGTVNILSVIGTPSATVGTTRGLFIQQANSANAQGLDVGILIDNADTDLAIGSAIQITSSGGGYTNIIDNQGVLISGSELNVLDGGIDESEVAGVITAVTAGSGLTGGGTAGAVTLDVIAGDGIIVNADSITIDAITTGITASTSSNSGLEVTASGLRLLGGCTADQILKWNAISSIWACAADSGGVGGSSAWSSLTAPTSNLALNHSEFTTAFTWDTAATASAFDGLTLAITNDATADSATQRLFTVRNNSATGGTTETLIRVDNADDNTVTNGVQVTSSGLGLITTAFDASDSAIVNALSIGPNRILGTTGTIDFDNFDVASTGTVTIAAGESYTGIDQVTLSSGGGANLILNSSSNTLVLHSTDTSINATGLSTITSSTSLTISPNIGTSYTLGTSATTLNLFNTTATDVNFAGGATGTLKIGSTTTGLNQFNADADLVLSGAENLDVTNATINSATNLIDVNATLTGDVSANGVDITVTDNNATSVGTNYALSVANADNGANAGVIDALALFSNNQATETLADGVIIRHNAASGTLTDALQIESTTLGGTITNGINIVNTAGTIMNGIVLNGTIGTGLDLSGASTTTDLILDDGLTLAQTSDNDLDIVEGGQTLNLDFGEATAGNLSFITSSGVDIKLDAGGGDVVLADTDVLAAGGYGGGSAFHVIGNAITSKTFASVADDNDLYIEGALEVDGNIQFDGTTFSAVNLTTFNCADCLDYDDFIDAMALDAATSIALGAFSHTLNASGAGHIVNNLSSTGNLLVQDSGVTFLTIDNAGAYAYILDSTDNPTYQITNNGSGAITTTLAGSGNQVFNLSSTGDFIIQDNSVEFLNISDAGAYAYTLDATDNPGYTVTNNGTGEVKVTAAGSGNIAFDLTATADLSVRDAGVEFLSISDTGAYSYTLDSTDNPSYTITNVGSSNVNTNLTGTGDFTLQDNSATVFTFNDSGNSIWSLQTGNFLQIDAASTDSTTTAGVIDVDVDTSTASNVGFDLNYEVVNDGVVTAKTMTAAQVLVGQNDVSGNTTRGLLIQQQAVTATGSGNSLDALLVLDNADTDADGAGADTAASLNDAIRITGSGTGAITTGLDFDSTNIVTDIEFQNDATLANDTNGEISLGENSRTLILDFAEVASRIKLESGSELEFESTNGSATGIVIDSVGGGIDITASGTVGEDIDITASGSSVNISSAEGVADAITLLSTNGGIDITTTGAVAGEDIDIISSASLNLTAQEGMVDALVLASTSATTAGIRIDSGDGLGSVLANGNDIELRAEDDTIINITANGQLVIDAATNVNSTASAVVDFDADLTAANSTAFDLNFQSIQSTSGAVSGLLITPDQSGGTAAANTYTLSAIDIASVTGSCPVGATCVINDFDLQQGLTISNSDNNDLNLAENGLTLNLDFGETSASTITGSTASKLEFESTADGATALKLEATAGGIDIVATSAVAGEDINITATGSSLNLQASEAVTDAIKLEATGTGGSVQITAGTGEPAARNDGSDVELRTTDDILFTAGDDINAQLVAGGQIIVDGSTNTNTTTDGILRIVGSTAQTGNVGLYVDHTSASGVAAGADVFGAKIDLTQNDTDGDLFGLYITNKATAALVVADATECLICVENAENTAGVVSDAIRISSSAATAGSIGTGLDFDTTDITTDIEFQNNETLTNDTNGSLVFTGVGGTNNAALTLDLDGATNAIPTFTPGNSHLGVNGNLTVGLDGSTAESIDEAGFAFSGNDMYIEDMLGVNGNAFIDGALDVDGATTLDGSTTLTVGGVSQGVFTIGNGAGNDFLEFVEEGSNPTCGAGDYKIWVNNAAGENKFKKCQNGALSDMDAAGAWNAITAPTGDTSLNHQEFNTTFTWDTPATAAAKDYWIFALTNDATTDATAQQVVTIRNNDSTGTTATETLLVLDNADTTEIVNDSLLITSAAGAITDAIDASDPEILNALNVGDNIITGGDWTVINTTDIAEGLTFTLAGGVGFDIIGAAGQDFRVTNTGGSIQLNATEAAGDAIVLNASNAAGGVDINFGTGDFQATGTGSGADFLVDAAGAVSLDSTGASSNFTVTGSALNLTLAVAGGGAQELVLSSAGTGTAAINIDVTGAGGDLDIDINDAITVDAGAGGMTFTTSGGNILLNNSSGAGDIVGEIDADSNVQFTAVAAPGLDMVSISNAGQVSTTTGVDGLSIDFSTGVPGGATDNAAIRLALTSGSTVAGSTLYGLDIGNITGQTNTTESAIRIGSGWDVGISSLAATALVIESGTTGTITIGGDASAEALNFGTGGADKDIIIGSTNTGSSLMLRSSTGNITIDPGATTNSLFFKNLIIPATGTAQIALCADTQANGRVQIGQAAGAASASCSAASSRRFKHDINSISDDQGLGYVRGLAPVTYVYNSDTPYGESLRWGFIAEEVAEVLPEIVGYDEQGRPATLDITQFIAINTAAIKGVDKEVQLNSAFATGGLQSLDQRVTILDSRVNALETQSGSNAAPANSNPTFDTVTATNVLSTSISATDVSASQVVGTDIGQRYYSNDSAITNGDVVMLDPAATTKVKKADIPYGGGLIGVATTAPSLLIDSEGNGPSVIVAAAGRVSVKVSTQNGAIVAGDPLTASSAPGVAMKATQNGPIIGRAVMDYNGEGVSSIIAVVNNGVNAKDFGADINALTSRLSDLEQQVQGMQTASPSAGQIDLTNLQVGTMTVDLDLIVHGALVVDGPATFKEAVRFEKDATFEGDVAVKGTATLNKDAAGLAKIAPGQSSILITFSKPYSAPPVITVSLGDGKFATYSYRKVTANSFEIVLQTPATEELTFSWQATSVNGVQTFVNQAPAP